jgi:hypothetical protein
MMGMSGVLVTLDAGVLPLEDAALGLSRIPRFAGQTIFPWTVLDHLLAGMLWARRNGASEELELHFGLHDYHEAMTSDVPTTFKTKDLRSIQRKLDTRLYRSLDLHLPEPDDAVWVHALDGDMLLAEARVCCPSKTYRRIVEERGGREASHAHIVTVQAVLAEGYGVDDWLDRITYLITRVREGL